MRLPTRGNLCYPGSRCRAAEVAPCRRRLIEQVMTTVPYLRPPEARQRQYLYTDISATKISDLAIFSCK